MLAQVTTQAASDLSWFNWLPKVLLQQDSYFTALVSFAAFGLAKIFPKTDKLAWIPEAASIIVGVLASCGLKIGGSYVYSVGCGIIFAWAASSFYNLGFFWLTAKLRAIAGQPATSTAPNEPLQLPPKP